MGSCKGSFSLKGCIRAQSFKVSLRVPLKWIYKDPIREPFQGSTRVLYRLL